MRSNEIIKKNIRQSSEEAAPRRKKIFDSCACYRGFMAKLSKSISKSYMSRKQTTQINGMQSKREREITNELEMPLEVFIVASHWGDEDQSFFKTISPLSERLSSGIPITDTGIDVGKGDPIHCWVRRNQCSHLKVILDASQKLKVKLLCDVAIPLLVIYTKDSAPCLRDRCTSTAITSLFPVAGKCRQPR